MERACPYCGKKLKGNEYGAHFKNTSKCLRDKKANKETERGGIGRMEAE